MAARSRGRHGRPPERPDARGTLARPRDVGDDVLGGRVLHANVGEEVSLFWLEDPLVEQDLDGYRQLRAAVTTRICTGEKGWTGDHFGRLIYSGALDVIMIDPGKAEGVTGTWNVIRAASAASRDWNAHSWSSALNTAASLHLATASDNVLVMELKPLPSPMQHELVTNPIVQHDGWVSAPSGPGLGVEVDEAVVRRYLFE